MKLLIIIFLLTLVSCFKTELEHGNLPIDNSGDFTISRYVNFGTAPGGNYTYTDANNTYDYASQYAYPESMGYIMPTDACLELVDLNYDFWTSTDFRVLVNNHDITGGAFTGLMSGQHSVDLFNKIVYAGEKIVFETYGASALAVADNYTVTLTFYPCY